MKKCLVFQNISKASIYKKKIKSFHIAFLIKRKYNDSSARITYLHFLYQIFFIAFKKTNLQYKM